MKWLEYRIDTTEEGLEAVYARLEAIGIESIEMRLSAEHIAADLDACRGTWDFAEGDVLAPRCPAVVAYIPVDSAPTLGAAVEREMRALADMDIGLDLGSLAVTVGEIEELDWAENWKKNFCQIRIGNRFIVCPSWETPKADADDVVIMMDSGLAFGTGQHETTRMCLELYERTGVKKAHILDIGCGSGILSIGALLDGAVDAVALDIDPAAAETAESNAEGNGIDASRYAVYAGDILNDKKLFDMLAERKYGVVFANIVAGVLIQLNKSVSALLAEGGRYILSGIIAERFDDVAASLAANGFDILEALREGEWCAILAKRVGDV